jgi:hypothetical protein
MFCVTSRAVRRVMFCVTSRLIYLCAEWGPDIQCVRDDVLKSSSQEILIQSILASNIVSLFFRRRRKTRGGEDTFGVL